MNSASEGTVSTAGASSGHKTRRRQSKQAPEWIAAQDRKHEILCNLPQSTCKIYDSRERGSIELAERKY